MTRRTMFALVVTALVVAAPAFAQVSCISDLAFELNECGIRRGPNEPAAHCGSLHRGTGSNGWSERQVLRVKPEEKPIIAAGSGGDPDGVGLDRSTGVETMTWGQVKHVLAAR